MAVVPGPVPLVSGAGCTVVPCTWAVGSLPSGYPKSCNADLCSSSKRNTAKAVFGHGSDDSSIIIIVFLVEVAAEVVHFPRLLLGESLNNS